MSLLVALIQLAVGYAVWYVVTDYLAMWLREDRRIKGISFPRYVMNLILDVRM